MPDGTLQRVSVYSLYTACTAETGDTKMKIKNMPIETLLPLCNFHGLTVRIEVTPTTNQPGGKKKKTKSKSKNNP